MIDPTPLETCNCAILVTAIDLPNDGGLDSNVQLQGSIEELAMLAASVVDAIKEIGGYEMFQTYLNQGHSKIEHIRSELTPPKGIKPS